VLTALCREQVVRTVFGDDCQPKKIYSATFDILMDDSSAVATGGKKLLFSGLRFTNPGEGLRLECSADAPTSILYEYTRVAQEAFEALKW